MNWTTISSIAVKNFGPFEGEQRYDIPENGMVLVKGLVTETMDGSGSGKSLLLKAIAYLYGCCPDPATELQSWFSDESPEVTGTFETNNGQVIVKRKNGLTITGDQYKQPIKGKAAEAELDKIFGMDKESRGIVTYRGQRKPGLFLSLSDEKKKSFLGGLLGLETYETIAKDAQAKLQSIGEKLLLANFSTENTKLSLENAKSSLESIRKELASLPKVDSMYLEKQRDIIKEKKLLVSNISSEIEAVKQDVYATQATVIAQITGKINALNQKNEPLEVTAIKNELTSLNSKLESFKQTFLTEKNAILKEQGDLQAQFTKATRQKMRKDGLEEEVRKLTDKLKILKGQQCSECKREWSGPSFEEKVSLVTKEIDRLNKEINDFANIKQVITDLQHKIDNPRTVQYPQEFNDTESKTANLNTKLKEIIKSTSVTRDAKLLELKDEEKKTRERFTETLADRTKDLLGKKTCALNELERAENDERILLGQKSQVDTKIAIEREREGLVTQLEGTYKFHLAEQTELQKAFSLEKDIVALFGKQGFLGSIVEEVLIEIASVTNDILSQIANVRHLSIDFETEKEAASTGNVTARIVPVIYSRGRIVSFSSGISGGMQAAVELAVDLAVGEVISRRRGSYPNWLILDETFHGLGSIAKGSCLEMLQSYAGNRVVFVVDHSSEFQGLFHNVITVEMTDGKSKIVV